MPPTQCAPLAWRRYANPLAACHDASRLRKFEELVEAAIDLQRMPDECVIAAAYDMVSHTWRRAASNLRSHHKLRRAAGAAAPGGPQAEAGTRDPRACAGGSPRPGPRAGQDRQVREAFSPRHGPWRGGDAPAQHPTVRRMDWLRAQNQRLRCLRITAKEERAVRTKLQVRRRTCTWWRAQHAANSRQSCACSRVELRECRRATWSWKRKRMD